VISSHVIPADLVICYSVEEGLIDRLRRRIEEITYGAGDRGLSTFAYVRDVQGWDTRAVDYSAAFSCVIDQIRVARAVVLDLTTDAGATRTGLSIEAGGARALNKPIIAIWRHPDRPDKLLSIASISGAYDSGAETLRCLTSSLVQQLGHKIHSDDGA
jgi:hypothetical protein